MPNASAARSRKSLPREATLTRCPARTSEGGRTGIAIIIETITQRDIKDLARIREIEVLPRIVALAAAQTAQLFNLAEIAGPFRLSRPTIGDYVTLLEQVFLIQRLPSWHSNRLSRLIKAPKLREAVGARFAAGVVLYDGEITIPFGEGLFAVPLSRLWT